MINTQKLNKRTSLLALCVVTMSCVSLAAIGGDDDKEKNKGEKSNDKITMTRADSIKAGLLLEDIEIQVDDTLVFEDWENPSEGGIGTSGELSQNNTIGNRGSKFNTSSSMDAISFSSIAKSLKKEYRVEFTIYPNPTTEKLHIKPSITPNSIRIADITGKEHHASSFEPQVNVTMLPKGVYIIQLIYADHIEARKFIKS
ncbi:MAG: T9SS type A sorting domain-containing protein [Bacteroidia bacterium]